MIKNFSLLIILFSLSTIYSQEEVLTKIAHSEMKSARAKMNFVANSNTSNYDITYHKLEFTVDPAKYFISGTVTTTFIALSDMTTVTFDLTNQLSVSSVTSNGSALNFIQNANNELVITLSGKLSAQTSATVVINYSGEPATGEEAFTTSTHAGTPVLYTLSEPFGARDWWPCKQDLNDKVDKIDVYITAPSQYVSVSNGKQMGQVFNDNGTKTTHFEHNHPIPAYLIAIAATNYSIYTQQAGTAPKTFSIINYIYPESLDANKANLDKTLPIMNLYEQLFESYPYSDEKYGHAQFGWGGGMEHTTISFMGGFGRELIAHELGHQWFGDKVTCGSWRDIWLNEGFATYLTSMVIENLDGQNAFVAEKNKMISNITSAPYGAVYLTEAEATDVDRIFDSRLTYNKGAMVLNMLRFKLGDAVFFQALKNYLADPNLAYSYALTPQLKAHFESASGLDLTEFFNDWIYNQGYPIYNIQVQNLGSGQAQFTINQTQSHISVSFFEMPVPVRVFGTNNQQMDLVLNNTSNGQVFIQSVPFTITSIEFDPNKNIISKNSTSTLGLFDVAAQGIHIYPNPASDKLFIEVTALIDLERTTVYNSFGQLVLEGSSTTIDLEKLSTGIYFIDITTSAGKYREKFLVR